MEDIKMKQKKNGNKKIIFFLIFILFLCGAATAGILIINDQNNIAGNDEEILSVNMSSIPIISNAFIDKEKYFPGDIMLITVETKDASETKAFVENEAGFNEVDLVVAASFEGKETWTGNWKVVNSVEEKIYKLKIIASNKFGTAETVLEWEDPNPGHPWNQIDNFPAACPAGEYINQLGSSPVCSVPSGGISASSVWVQKTTNYNAGCSGGWGTYCSHNVGLLGGRMGTSDITPEHHTSCVTGKRILVNGVVQTSTEYRVDISLPPGALVEVQTECKYNTACTTVYNVRCEIGLWDF